MTGTAKKMTDRAFLRALCGCVLGMLACTVCFVGATLAWMTQAVETGRNTLTAASFDPTVTVCEVGGEVCQPTDGQYALDGNKSYAVTLLSAGQEGTASVGYCKIALGQTGGEPGEYYTRLFGKDESYTFTVSGFTVCRITAMWGEQPSGLTEDILIDKAETVAGAPLMLSQCAPAAGKAETQQTEQDPATEQMGTESEQTSAPAESVQQPAAESERSPAPAQSEPTTAAENTQIGQTANP